MALTPEVLTSNLGWAKVTVTCVVLLVLATSFTVTWERKSTPACQQGKFEKRGMTHF